METKKPFLKLTVGAQYIAINTPNAQGEYDPTKFSPTIKQETVKTLGTTENSESSNVRSSGILYETISQTSSVELALDVVAFDVETLAKLRGDVIDESGLISSGRASKRPYFAFGYVERKLGGVRYVWYPKCQLVENSDDIKTSEEKFSEQNSSIKIRAYSFNEMHDVKNYIDSEISSFPKGITEDKFFEKPILTKEQLKQVSVGG